MIVIVVVLKERKECGENEIVFFVLFVFFKEQKMVVMRKRGKGSGGLFLRVDVELFEFLDELRNNLAVEYC